MVGATHVNGGGLAYYLGTGTSFNVSHIPGYQNLTAGNFIVKINGVNGFSSNDTNGFNSFSSNGCSPSVSYNASTGIVTVNSTSFSVSGKGNNPAYATGSISVSLFLVKGKIKTLS